MDILDERKIYDKAIVTNAQPACVVAAATNRNLNVLLPAELKRR